jgi:hypothetical protein
MGLMVRGLSAGGSEIRTLGPPAQTSVSRISHCTMAFVTMSGSKLAATGRSHARWAPNCGNRRRKAVYGLGAVISGRPPR